MPTSTAARSTELPSPAGPRHAEAGFTLIELGLVLLIIGVAIAVIVPRFQDQSRAELTSQTRKLATTFRFLQHEAILNGRMYQLSFDLDQQRYFVTSGEVGREGGPALERESGILARDVVLPNTVQISDVVLEAGKVYEGGAFVNFYPDGYVDPAVVHLDNGQEVYTLYVPDGITGRAYIASGYLDIGSRG